MLMEASSDCTPSQTVHACRELTCAPPLADGRERIPRVHAMVGRMPQSASEARYANTALHTVHATHERGTMEHSHGLKTPLQIRLDHAELAALDAYIAQFTDFPPSRVDVVRKALTEWLVQKRESSLYVQTPQRPTVGQGAVAPLPQPIKPAWQAIVAILQQRQEPLRPDEIVAALGCKPESLAAHLRFMVKAGLVGSQEVGQGKAKRKAYFLTVLQP